MPFVLLLALCLPAHAGEASAGAASTGAVAATVAPDALPRYDAIRRALSEDRLDDARAAAGDLATVDAGLAAPAGTLAQAADLGAARHAFGELSRALVSRLANASPPAKVSVYFCPMWTGFAWWIQPKAGIANPYMGKAMPDCGEERSLKAAAKAAAVPAP